MLQEFVAVIQGIGHTLTKGLPISIALGLVFTALSFLWACNPGQVWWRKRDLVTDLCYWFFIPLFSRYLRECGLLDDAAERQMTEQAKAEVDEAVEFARASPFPPASLTADLVYA